MAKIVTSALVADVRKKIGGNVFTKGRHGAFTRRKVSPVQPRTQTQRNVRANFSSLAKAWSGASMDDTKRAAWNALATNYPQKDKFGASHILTGLQMFLKLNRVLNSIGIVTLYDAPATLEAGFPGGLTITATSPGTLTVATDNNAPAGQTKMYFAAAQQSPGRTFVGNRYRLIDYDAGAGAYDIATLYMAKFGPLIAGKKVPVLVAFANTSTGAKGVASAALKVVT
jgi:hypothetical protein